ncbi:hypothetical protein FHX52_3263 [Humibacillus xanthopallidus]|uniref:Restriction endonuclease n=1 Tax=Humibacillus xanthopallidus TaxID=412689 RepID=A0A543PR38_9MICO|nr:hypothetical protein [Humibacillus xanthopallidus]TQN46538.1 hypothetical protein FHX52_3263 [Humibacillus xanthopallidus]
MTASSHTSKVELEASLIQLCEQMLVRHSAAEPKIVRHEPAFFNVDVPDSPRVIRIEGRGEFLSAITEALESGPVICIPPLVYNPKTHTSPRMLSALTSKSEYPLVVVSTWTGLESHGDLGPSTVPPGRRPLVVLNAHEPRRHRVAVLSVPVTSDYPNVLRMFRYDAGDEPKLVRRQLDQLLKRRNGAMPPFGYVIDQPELGLTSLRFDTHDPELRRRNESLSEFGSSEHLTDLFSVVRPIPPPTDGAADEDALQEDAARLESLDVLNVDRTGRAYRTERPLQPDLEIWADEVIELHEGDLLLSPKSPGSLRHGLHVIDVRVSDLPSQAASGTITLRPRQHLSPAHRRIIRAYLGSDLLKETLRANIPSSMQGFDYLAHIQVPRPDDGLAASIVEIDAAAARLYAWLTEADALLATSFDRQDAREARRMLVGAGRLLRLRVEGAAALDDFSYAVRTRYPHPLAYRWRAMEAQLDGQDVHAAYREILECYEVLLTFVAQIGLVVALEAGEQVKSVAAVREKLRIGRSGTGIGDWVAILEELSGPRFVGRDLDPALISACGFLERTGTLAQSRKRMSERRNDYAHLRRLPVDRMPSELDDAYQDLKALMQRAEFLTDLKLLSVETTRLNAFEGTSEVKFRQMMGDHSIVPLESQVLRRNDIEAGSLYISDSSGGWHLIRPFLYGGVCPECHTWSTFHLDRRDKGELVLKSLEHGHTMRDASQRSALEQVGLL